MSCWQLVWTSHFRFVGPEYWGEAYAGNWHMCSKGKQQSPINIEPDLLLYDSNLGRLVVNSPPVSLLNGLDRCFFWLFGVFFLVFLFVFILSFWLNPCILNQRNYQFTYLFKGVFVYIQPYSLHIKSTLLSVYWFV